MFLTFMRTLSFHNKKSTTLAHMEVTSKGASLYHMVSKGINKTDKERTNLIYPSPLKIRLPLIFAPFNFRPYKVRDVR